MKFDLSERDRPFIIAEAGTCHAAKDFQSRQDLMLGYIKAATDIGVDAIKFQLFKTPIKEDMFCWIDGDEERSKRWAQSELPYDAWAHASFNLNRRAKPIFLASVFQDSTVEWVKEMRLSAVKVASRAASRFPYGALSVPHLISHGMEPPPALPDETPQFSTYNLECESVYPSTARWEGSHLGFSDHSGNPDRAIDAMNRGCKLVEVHFYVDRQDARPDEPASLNLDQLREVCAARDALSKEKEKNVA